MEQTRDAELIRIRRIATGALVLLCAVFLLTLLVPDPPGWVRLIRAMAEAGMVGGLADWFAVEALFRHPLGLPIPHTALIPRNQKRAADNIARFIDEYFLTPDQLIARIRQADPVAHLAGWLKRPENADRVAGELSSFGAHVAAGSFRDSLGGDLGRSIARRIPQAIDTRALAEEVGGILRNAVNGPVFDEVVKQIHHAIDNNRPEVYRIAQNHSRWWIASNVDRRVVDLLLNAVVGVVASLEEDTEARRTFQRGLAGAVDRFVEQGLIAGFLDSVLDGYRTDPGKSARLEKQVAAILDALTRRAADNPERMAHLVSSGLQRLAADIESDPRLRRDIDNRMLTVLESVVEQARPAIVDYISSTISGWDSDDLVARLESEVGRDLQFIRINGAVLGALLGGLIFALGALAGSH